MGIFNQLKRSFNVFNTIPTENVDTFGNGNFNVSYGSSRPDRTRMRIANDKSIISAIYNQIGIDVAAVDIEHVRVDRSNNDQYVETMASSLNSCLTFEANLDEGSRAFIQNAVMTLFDKGTIAIVPVETSDNPNDTGSYDIQTMRIGEITEWRARHVKVMLYDDRDGVKREVKLEKRNVAIVENPLYAVMNEPNSTLQRLIRKLGILDSLDEQAGSGKLDLIIQLPYVIKTEAKKQQAEMRRADIEDQLKGSKYGIAYTDGTERVTQLNRPAENNMLKHVEYLTSMLYSQLGLTEEVFKGTANDVVMNNYYNRTLEPILKAITQAMERAFLTKTARTQGQAIKFFKDPFKLLSIKDVAELSDKLIRNQVATPNDMRSAIGWKPSKDSKADMLQNPNMPTSDTASADPSAPPTADTQTSANTSMAQDAQDAQDAMMEEMFTSLEGDINKIINDASGG